ncbi:PH domain-containing protein [Microbacterium radiodurans]|uniref:PH domain-containing protein n=1 Tax=Microbacterium radiodurans TaxID=661398 RepID=A0A5J5IN80_9MICO|nr:PH domain-containing protein [Microbacterium radiodurans]KAA9085073.1 PH domain-containing protein [Microbacterium radiodurans]
MTQPAPSFGRPVAPAPGAAAPELRVARFRTHARRLIWPALLLIVVAGAVGFFSGNLPDPFTDLMLWSAAGVVVLLLVVLPFLRWFAHAYTVTTRRVIETSGLIVRRRAELSHVRGYSIRESRGPIQRIWGTGTLELSNGVDPSLRLVNIPAVSLVHEVLADQVEVSQILAHRDSHSMPTIPPQDIRG